MATQIVPAPQRANDQGMSLADVAAHEAASHVVAWRTRENFLRGLVLDGDIRTAGGQQLASQSGHWADITVTVDYVSPVSPDGEIFLVIADPHGTGRALAVTDASELASARAWMYRDDVSLFGKAVKLLGQPGIDLRRATAVAS
ncbi:MAG: hypothetical protein HOZ81_20345 [Streptomyces sp.]|nr:hypothetical protein [Streptomyces sp.]NUS81892.1 hypothetical protein [Streptomyces sp.]